MVSVVQSGKVVLDLLPLYCDLRKVLVERFRGCHPHRHFDILHLALFKKGRACFLQAKNNILAACVTQKKVSSKQNVADVKRQMRHYLKELKGRITELELQLAEAREEVQAEIMVIRGPEQDAVKLTNRLLHRTV